MTNQPKFRLELYIAGLVPKSEQLITDLREKLVEYCDNDFDLLVVSVFDDPEMAINRKILATPTLIKMLPSPVKRLIGDLSDVERVLKALDITPLT